MAAFDWPEHLSAIPRYRGIPTIRRDWERFYGEFPDRYDRFTPTTDTAVAEVDRLVGLAGMAVLDIASGSGRSSRELARRARSVVGFEPLAGARAYAASRGRAEGIDNVEFLEGTVEQFPDVHGRLFDVAVSIHAAPFLLDDDEAANAEELRALLERLAAVVRPGGAIAFAGTRPPDGPDPWHAVHVNREVMARRDRVLAAAGFEVHDRPISADFGTMDEALATCGFIYGESAIDYLLEGGAPIMHLLLRVHVTRL